MCAGWTGKIAHLDLFQHFFRDAVLLQRRQSRFQRRERRQAKTIAFRLMPRKPGERYKQLIMQAMPPERLFQFLLEGDSILTSNE